MEYSSEAPVFLVDAKVQHTRESSASLKKNVVWPRTLPTQSTVGCFSINNRYNPSTTPHELQRFTSIQHGQSCVCDIIMLRGTRKITRRAFLFRRPQEKRSVFVTHSSPASRAKTPRQVEASPARNPKSFVAIHRGIRRQLLTGNLIQAKSSILRHHVQQVGQTPR